MLLGERQRGTRADGGETDAKKAFPKTLESTMSSNREGMSVSIPSSARNWSQVSPIHKTSRLTNLVVLDVVLLEHHRVRHADGEVCEDG